MHIHALSATFKAQVKGVYCQGQGGEGHSLNPFQPALETSPAPSPPKTKPAKANALTGSSLPKFALVVLQQGLHAQYGVILCGKNFIKLGRVAGVFHVGLIGNHINEVINAVQIFCGSINP